MKGIELPVNVLVIVAIAVIVLLGLVALFMGGFGGFASTVESTNAWSNACGNVLPSCGSDHASDGITPVEVAGKTASDFGQLCGLMGRYDHDLVSFDSTSMTWAAVELTTGYANTAINGCNWACGCPQN